MQKRYPFFSTAVKLTWTKESKKMINVNMSRDDKNAFTDPPSWEMSMD